MGDDTILAKIRYSAFISRDPKPVIALTTVLSFDLRTESILMVFLKE